MFGAIVGQILNLHLAAIQPKTPYHQWVNRMLNPFTMGGEWGYRSVLSISLNNP
jgi:hypothetical protein